MIFNLNALLFTTHAGIDVLAQVQAHNTLQANFPDNNLTPQEAATYLLSQVYPEGSPNHPTYTSGHATVAGACATILKAFFDKYHPPYRCLFSAKNLTVNEENNFYRYPLYLANRFPL